MSELTYKKITDVDIVEALNDDTTVFVNDNGAMKQLDTDKLGTVKTVNGIEPDENGEVAFFHSKSFNFADGSLIVPGMINYYGTETMAEVIGWLQSSGTYNVEIKRLVMQTNNDLVNKMCTSYKTYKNDEGGYNAILYFEDDLCPVILNGTNNTITLDPDWVAPTACVKTVNGVAPNENGDLTVVEPQTFVFTNIDGDVDCPYEVSELIKFATNASAYKSVRFVHRVRDLFNPSVPIRDYVWTGASIPATGTGVFQINFGDEIAPILINSNANTITLDPDWVAPEANITESAANTLVDTKVAELATTVDTKLSELAAQELSLPQSAGVVDHGTAGQFAVSDGMGGIMWKTLVEAEEVSY